MKNPMLFIALCFFFSFYTKCSSDSKMAELEATQTEMTAKIAHQDTVMKVNNYNMVKQINYATLMGQYGLPNLVEAHDSVTNVMKRHYAFKPNKAPVKETK